MSAQRSLEGKNALVTGAAGGIGLAIARRFIVNGARVVIADLQGDRLKAAVQSLPAGAMAVPADISSEAGVDAMMAAAVASAGEVDILVNNAGVAEPIVRTIDQRLMDWQRVMDINLRGTYLACRAFARHLLPRKMSGSIVNIASVAGLGGIPSSNAYGVSKAAIVHLTRNLACEWAARRLRVNCVAPGYIDAPMAHEMFADSRVDRQGIEARVPMHRLGEADEIASVVAFLASDAASYVTGVTLPVDGGWCAYGGV
ncbi:MAG: SDR family oxidoreductase [Rhizobiales bacterium]|nr:SDR family oxidoreductase [Hyphomicrobiales bacterium]